MRISILFLFLFPFSLCSAQTLPFDFESGITTANFINFGGGTATVLANPQVSGINTSNTVAQIVRDGGEVFAGSKIVLPSNLDFSQANGFKMKVFTSAPAGTVVKFKLEGAGAIERDVVTTTSNAWEELTWDFTGAPSNFNEVVFMFDFGNVGNGSTNSTFLFDDVSLVSLGAQIDLPVTFEDAATNYTLTSFEGGASDIVVDPTDASNTVGKVIKASTAGTSAGTTIGTNAGFASNIPLSLTDSKMNVRVWTPIAGLPIRLKVEDSNDPTHTCETQTMATAAGWQTLTFDFANEAPGTESLAVGLSMGWTYNMASIFFNFGTGGSANEQVYYFDDVRFGEVASSTRGAVFTDFRVYPNPASEMLFIQSDESLDEVRILTIDGKLVLAQADVTNLELKLDTYVKGSYIVHLRKGDKIATEQIVVE